MQVGRRGRSRRTGSRALRALDQSATPAQRCQRSKLLTLHASWTASKRPPLCLCWWLLLRKVEGTAAAAAVVMGQRLARPILSSGEGCRGATVTVERKIPKIVCLSEVMRNCILQFGASGNPSIVGSPKPNAASRQALPLRAVIRAWSQILYIGPISWLLVCRSRPFKIRLLRRVHTFPRVGSHSCPETVLHFWQSEGTRY